MKKINIFKLFVAILIPLAVGSLSALMSWDSMAMFDSVKKPVLSPPGFLFPIVWTILYVLMGISSYLIYMEKENGSLKSEANSLLTIYGIQLIFNFFWSIIFFKFSMYKFAFAWLLVL